MYTVKIMNEYLHGPVWVYNEDGIVVRTFPIIYDDPVIRKLNEQAEQMFSSYFEFDSHNEACWFNREKEREDKIVMLDIIETILSRLDFINDGSFVVKDYETDRLRSL